MKGEEFTVNDKTEDVVWKGEEIGREEGRDGGDGDDDGACPVEDEEEDGEGIVCWLWYDVLVAFYDTFVVFIFGEWEWAAV